MDIPRPKKKRVWRRLAYAVVMLGGIAGISLGLRFMEPAAPTVERGSVWTDTVKRGPMVREVRGAGQLLPEQIWWIPAPSEGRVEQVLALPGAAVTADSI